MNPILTGYSFLVFFVTVERSFPFALDLLTKLTLLLTSGFATIAVMRRSSAAGRHVVLASIFVAALVLPLVCIEAPAVFVRILPQPSPYHSTLAWSRPSVAHLPYRPTGDLAVFVLNRPKSFHVSMPPLKISPTTRSLGTNYGPRPAEPSGWITLGPVFLGLTVWLIGSLVFMFRLINDLLLIKKVAMLSVPADQPAIDSAEDCQRAIGLRSPVAVVRSQKENITSVPVTWGLVRPVILLPSSGSEWTQTCVRSALLHEMAHIKRNDWVLQIVSNSVCALYWFHPLVWLAAARLRSEAEYACDDEVLLAGVPAEVYAQGLVETVRSIKRRSSLRRSVTGMASAADVVDRISAILESGKQRQPLTRSRVVATVATLALCLVPLSALHLNAQSVKSDVLPGNFRPTKMETMDGQTLFGGSLPPGGQVVPRGVGSLVMYLFPQVSTQADPNLRYTLAQMTGPAESTEFRFTDRTTGRTFGDDASIAKGVAALLAEGTAPRPGTMIHEFPDVLAFATGSANFSAYLTPTQTSEALNLSLEAQEWNEFMSQAEYVLDDGDLESASVRTNSQVGNRLPELDLTFSPRGKKSVADVTGANIGKILAIFINHKLASAAFIEEKLASKSCEVLGAGLSKTDLNSVVATIPTKIATWYDDHSAPPSITAGVKPLVSQEGGKATLPNGYSVAVEGITRAIPEEWSWRWNLDPGPWWDADGRPIAIPVRYSDWSRGDGSVLGESGVAPYDVWFSIKSPPSKKSDSVTFVESIKGAIERAGDSSYTRSEGMIVAVDDQPFFPGGASSCTAYVGIGDGPWKTIASKSVKFSPIPGEIISSSTNNWPDVVIDLGKADIEYYDDPDRPMTYAIALKDGKSKDIAIRQPVMIRFRIDPTAISDNCGRRVVAVDDEGHLTPLVPEGRDTVQLSFPKSPGSRFNLDNPTVQLSHIRELLFQTRPCQIAELRNISLVRNSSGFPD